MRRATIDDLRKMNQRLAEALVYAAEAPMTETLRLLGTPDDEIARQQVEWVLNCPEHYEDTLNVARAYIYYN